MDDLEEHISKMFEQEPEPLDENDPEVREEMFETLKYIGARPEDLPDPEERKQYAAWFELHANDTDDETSE